MQYAHLPKPHYSYVESRWSIRSGFPSFAETAREDSITAPFSFALDELRVSILAVVFLVFALATHQLTIAQAQSEVYMIPLEGGRWDTNRITVEVPSGPGWAQNVVIEAMNIWGHSQEWFANTYNLKENPYQLLLQLQKVKADLPENLGTISVNFVDVPTGNNLGATDLTVSSTKVFTSGVVTLPVSYHGEPLNDSYAPWFTSLVIHMFGHVLGLDDVHGFCDVMEEGNSSCHSSLPSTLDLYAVYVLAGGHVPHNVTLPSSIAYQEPPATAVPEFPMFPLLLSVVLVLCFGTRASRKPIRFAQASPRRDRKP